MAQPKDAEALLGIYRPYVEETSVSFEFEVPSLAEFERRIRENSAVYPYIICEDDGIVSGYAYAHRFRERAGFNWDAELSVYVRKGHTGQGIGRLLYETIERIVEKQGIYNLYASISCPNEPSVALHRERGFVTEAVLKNTGCKFGVWHDLIIMRKKLREYEENPKAIKAWHEVFDEADL